MLPIHVTHHAVKQCRKRVLHGSTLMTDAEIISRLVDIVRFGKVVQTRPTGVSDYRYQGIDVVVAADPGRLSVVTVKGYRIFDRLRRQGEAVAKAMDNRTQRWLGK